MAIIYHSTLTAPIAGRFVSLACMQIHAERTSGAARRCPSFLARALTAGWLRIIIMMIVAVAVVFARRFSPLLANCANEERRHAPLLSPTSLLLPLSAPLVAPMITCMSDERRRGDQAAAR